MFFGLFNKPDYHGKTIDVFASICNRFNLDGRIVSSDSCYQDLAIIAPDGTVKEIKVDVDLIASYTDGWSDNRIIREIINEIKSQVSRFMFSCNSHRDFLYFGDVAVELANYVIEINDEI